MGDQEKQEIAGANEWEWFYESMAQWQLDHRDEALRIYQKAIDQMARQDSRQVKLRGYQADASLLLGLPDPGSRIDLAMDSFRKGLKLETDGQKELAIEAFAQSLDLNESLARDFPGVLAYTRNLTNLLIRCGRQQELEGVCRRAIAACNMLSGTAPEHRMRDSDHSHELALILLAAGARH